MDKYAVECRELGIPYFYDPSQQVVRMDASQVRRGIEGARSLFVNEYELAIIKKITGMSEADVLAPLDFMVITAGKDGAYIYQRGDVCHIPAVPPLKVVDPTGIGDAFRGGFLKGYSCGFDLTTCGQIGSLAATYCLENEGPQGQEYSPAEFVTRFREHFDDGGKLDVFLK